jgi:hypothetical protein
LKVFERPRKKNLGRLLINLAILLQMFQISIQCQVLVSTVFQNHMPNFSKGLRQPYAKCVLIYPSGRGLQMPQENLSEGLPIAYRWRRLQEVCPISMKKAILFKTSEEIKVNSHCERSN